MDLSLVSTDELQEELAKRFDHIIVAGYKILDDKTYELHKFYRSEESFCIFLCHKLALAIDHDLDPPTVMHDDIIY